MTRREIIERLIQDFEVNGMIDNININSQEELYEYFDKILDIVGLNILGGLPEFDDSNAVKSILEKYK